MRIRKKIEECQCFTARRVGGGVRMWVSRMRIQRIEKQLADLIKQNRQEENTLKHDCTNELFSINETKLYFNQESCLVEVSFSMPFHDWCELQKSNYWEQVVEFLDQKRNLDTQNFHKEGKG